MESYTQRRREDDHADGKNKGDTGKATDARNQGLDHQRQAGYDGVAALFRMNEFLCVIHLPHNDETKLFPLRHINHI